MSLKSLVKGRIKRGTFPLFFFFPFLLTRVDPFTLSAVMEGAAPPYGDGRDFLLLLPFPPTRGCGSRFVPEAAETREPISATSWIK